MKILWLAAFAALFSGCATEEEAMRMAAVATTTPYAPVVFAGEIEAAVRSRFRSALKDPDSLQLANVKASTGAIRHVPSTVVCGYFNSRNSFGGYTGFEPFAMEVTNGIAGDLWTDQARLRVACSSANAIPDRL